MAKVKASDVDRNCVTWKCDSCILPCSSCFSGRCEQCRFGYKTIVNRLIEAYAPEDLVKYSEKCPYAKMSCTKLGVNKSLRKENKVEQSLDKYELGTKLKIKIKGMDKVIVMQVGAMAGDKVLLNNLTCYLFDKNMMEILGEVE